MKKFGILISLFLMSSPVFAQAVRWDWNVQTINTIAPLPGAMYPVLAIPGAGISFCNAPANAVPCTNYATTYTSVTATTTCPSTAQLTRSNSATCVAKADSLGGFGVWITSGTYQYTVSTVYGNFGPYDVTVGFGSGPISGTSASFSGTVSAGATPPPGTIGLWGIASQGELNGATYATPDAAVTAACAAGGSKAVYFPTGVYTSGIPIRCNGLRIRCAARDTFASSGAIFRITGANWGLWNPDADNTTAGPTANQRRSLTISDCAFDISTDPTNVLGAWRIKGIGASTFIGNNIFANSNSFPAVTEDGSNYTNNGGDYDNDFISNTLYDNAGTASPLGGSKGIGWYLTNCSTFTGCAGQPAAASNDNHHFGGGASRFGTPVWIDGGGNNSFISIDMENPENVGILLGPGAGNNRFSKVRLETAISPWSTGPKPAIGQKILDSNNNYQTVSTTGTSGASAPTWCTTLNCTTTDGSVTWTLTAISPVLVRATGSRFNSIDIYASGYTQVVDDATGFNEYSSGTSFGLFLPGNNSSLNGTFFGSVNGWGKWGFGKSPYFANNEIFNGGVDVHGNLQSDRQLILCNFTNGCYAGQLATGSAISTFTTSGAGTGASISITSISNGQINAVRIISGGTGYAINDTITNITQITSSAASSGAILTVSSVDGSGGITGLTITNGGTATGYTMLRATNTGAIAFNLPSTGNGLSLQVCPTTGSAGQYCGSDQAWHTIGSSGQTNIVSATSNSNQGSVALPIGLDMNLLGYSAAAPRTLGQIEAVDQAANFLGSAVTISTAAEANTGIKVTITNAGAYTVVPTSITVTGFTGGSGQTVTPYPILVGGGVAIGKQTTGSGYSGSGTCTVNGGTFTVQATCTAVLTPPLLPAVIFDKTQVANFQVAVNTPVLTMSGTSYNAGVNRYTVSWTPTAATASTCTEQTVAVTGIITGQAVRVSPPSNMGTHLWIGSMRASAANTLAVAFCADATGGTPPSGTWLVTE
jgi:hypothetical protein